MLVRELRRSAWRLGLAGRRPLVAVSGGIDSASLLHALHELHEELDLNLSVAHVNHGLRGAESEADEAFVRELARGLDLPFQIETVRPEALREGRSSRDRPTPQEAARAVRYAALERARAGTGADCIATAHTSDDQAETVLLRLLRGTGPDGLAGIPERADDGRIVRPMLSVSRAQVEAYASMRGLRWREDSSNGSSAYARNRLRKLLPGLARDFNPRLLRACANLAEAQQRDAEWMGALVESEAASRFEVEGRWLRIDTRDWERLPEALTRRLARAALGRCGAGRHTSRIHLTRMESFLRGGRSGSHIELPGGVQLARDREGFRIGPIGTAC